MMCEPLRGWRHVRVTERRTRKDWAECIKELVDVHYPSGREGPFGDGQPEYAQRWRACTRRSHPTKRGGCWTGWKFHPTPKHGSWLDMAEIELGSWIGSAWTAGSMSADCGSARSLTWETDRNKRDCRIHWTFTLAAARAEIEEALPVNYTPQGTE